VPIDTSQYPVGQRLVFRRLSKIIEQFKCRTGVEIGVFKADTSAYLLSRFPKLEMLCVDPWKEWPKRHHHYRRTAPRTGDFSREKWNEVYREAAENLLPYAPRYQILRMMSKEVAELIRPEIQYDFVFIDGVHTRFHVRQDIDLWLPHTAKVICGHDYSPHKPGVKKAVNERFGKHVKVVDRSLVWFVDLEEFRS